ncbi:MAG: hypothetical protein LBE25_15385 [Arthrobacter sp.]|nr:hypothetical protein [Arthrobacter sp.]
MNPSRGTLRTILPVILGFALLGAALYMFRFQTAIAGILGVLGILVLALNLLFSRRER